MSKELRKSFIIGTIMGLILGWRLFLLLFSHHSFWLKLLALLLLLGTVGIWTYVYYHNFKFSRNLNRYVKKFNLSPAEVAQATGQGRYDFYYTSDNKTLVFYSSSEKLRKKVLTKLAEQYGAIDE